MSDPRTRLFVSLPAFVESGRAAACLRAFCARADVACLLLRAGEDGVHDLERARALVEAAQELDVAVVVENDVAVARGSGADGVHVTTGAGDAAAARQRLGDERIVGGECRARRHEAMALGEAGVDYLALDQRQEAGGENLLDWAAQLLVIPLVAIHPAAAAQMATLAARGADFVTPPEGIWSDEQSAARVAEACMNALREGEGQ